MTIAEPALMRRPRQSAGWANIFVFLVPVFAVLGIIAQINFLIAGFIYIVFYVALSASRRDWALMLVFALAPFVQDISIGGPFKFSIGELSLILAIPAVLLTSIHRVRVPIFLSLVFIYLGTCIASSVVNRDVDGATPILQMVIYLVIAVIVFSTAVPNVFKFLMIFDVAVLVMACMAFLGIATNFEFPALHKNAWGAGLSGGVVLTVELWMAATTRKRRFVLTIALGLIASCLLFTLSRGGWLAAITGTVIIIALRRQFRLLFRLLLLFIPLISILWYTLPAQERDYATGLGTDRANILARYQTIDDATRQFMAHPVLGIGIGYRKDIDATNIVMISLAESGIVGFAGFAAIHATLVWSMLRALKRIDRSHILYSPVALAAALPISRLAHGCVDHYWGRGPLLQTWGTVGMAMAIQTYFRRQEAVQGPE